MRTTELADELADKLEERSSNYTYHGHYNKEAASMLRQQAKEIKALKQRLELAKWYEETDEQVIANAEKRFPFLKKASKK